MRTGAQRDIKSGWIASTCLEALPTAIEMLLWTSVRRDSGCCRGAGSGLCCGVLAREQGRDGEAREEAAVARLLHGVSSDGGQKTGGKLAANREGCLTGWYLDEGVHPDKRAQHA